MEVKAKFHRRSISYTPNISTQIFSEKISHKTIEEQLTGSDLANDKANILEKDKTGKSSFSSPLKRLTYAADSFHKRDSGLHCPESASLECTSTVSIDEANNRNRHAPESVGQPDTLSVWSKLNVTSTELRRCAAEVVSLRTEKFALLRDRGELAEKVELLSRELEKFDGEQREIENLREEFLLKTSKIETEKRRLIQENENLRFQMQELAIELANIQQENLSLVNKNDVEKYILRIEFLQRNLESREGEIAELRMTNSCIVEKFNTQMAELFSIKEQHRIETESLRDKLFEIVEAKNGENQKQWKLLEDLSTERDNLKIELEKASSRLKDFSQLDLCFLCGGQKDEKEFQSAISPVGDSEAETTLLKKISTLQQRLNISEKRRRELNNKLQDIRGNIRVFVRCRPFLKIDNTPSTEEAFIQPSVHFHQDKTSVSLIPSAITSITSSSNSRGMQGSLNNPFLFDRVFNMQSSQEEVYKEVSELVQSALDGYRICIMSYGQSGSGKTYTMTGDTSDRTEWGIIPRALDDILTQSLAMKQTGWDEVNVSVSIVELYNEEINDLLEECSGNVSVTSSITQGTGNSSAGGNSRFKINRLNNRVIVSGLTSVQIDTNDYETGMSQFESLLNQSAAVRTTASTGMNESSSRSHLIVMIEIQGRHSDGVTAMQGGLRLCDLAGSERLDRTGNLNDANRLREAVNINKSLSCLSDVFLALNSRAAYVPHRNSKLTMLLQDCLSGNGRTLMVVNVSPTMASTHETLCSLRFANQVSQVELGKAQKNVFTIMPSDSTTNDASKDLSKVYSPPFQRPTSLHKRTASSGSGAVAVSQPASQHRRNYSADITKTMSAMRQQQQLKSAGVSREEKPNSNSNSHNSSSSSKSPVPAWAANRNKSPGTTFRSKSPGFLSSVARISDTGRRHSQDADNTLRVQSNNIKRKDSKGEDDNTVSGGISVSTAPTILSPTTGGISLTPQSRALKLTPTTIGTTASLFQAKTRSASASKAVPLSTNSSSVERPCMIPAPVSAKSRRNDSWKVLFEVGENGEPNKMELSDIPTLSSSSSLTADSQPSLEMLVPEAAQKMVGVAFPSKNSDAGALNKRSSHLNESPARTPLTQQSVSAFSPSPVKPLASAGKAWCM